MKQASILKQIIPSIVLILCLTGVLYSQQLAFPTAEGYGKYTLGGRGGSVYEVTTLNPSGPGSLGEAIAASGPRTVVFRVAGTIEGKFSIKNDNITITGQTAPGDGICIKGNLGISANNVIIRYIRVRNTVSGDAVSGGHNLQNIILDHISASWSSDEVMSLYQNTNVTFQWCIISEACSSSHRFGGIWGNNYSTYHHNLIAHNDSRNPRWASGCKYNDYRNNVLYNWGYNSCYGGEAQQSGRPEWNFSTINMIANYYKPGPATQSGVRDRIVEPSARSSDDKGSWYVADNYVDGYPTVTANNWLGVDGSNYIKLNAPWNAMPINQQTPEDAYLAVLAHAGCSLPNRDAIDARIIEEVRNATATYGNNGIITKPSDVGGWPALRSGIAPVDSDHDGMPNAWEVAEGLNPNNASDRNTVGADGYTMLESYLNSLVTQGSTVLHVDDDAANDPGPYNSNISDPLEDGSEDHPFDAIQEAIEVADDHATIRVHPGTYWETIDFQSKDIKVTGLSSDVSTPKSYPVIDANEMDTVVIFNQGEGPTCELSGFVLTRGLGAMAGAVLCDEASPTISHCVIVGNRCDDPNGGTLYCRDSDSLFDHCTISGNDAGPEGAAFRFVDCNVIIANSIVTGNSLEPILVELGSDPQVHYSNVEGLWPGIGNIDTDASFVREGQWMDTPGAHALWFDGDYHLTSRAGHWNPIVLDWVFDTVDSPCIDAGDPDAPVFLEPKPNGSLINMGAYGGTQQASRTVPYRTWPR
jgi:pectate lyase